jgi:hypothetical protein
VRCRRSARRTAETLRLDAMPRCMTNHITSLTESLVQRRKQHIIAQIKAWHGMAECFCTAVWNAVKFNKVQHSSSKCNAVQKSAAQQSAVQCSSIKSSFKKCSAVTWSGTPNIFKGQVTRFISYLYHNRYSRPEYSSDLYARMCVRYRIMHEGSC